MLKKLKNCTKCGLESLIWSSRGGQKLCKRCATTGVVINKPTIKAKPIAPRSQKRLLEERLYSVKRNVFLQNHPMCEAHVQGICTGQATEIHHKAGKIGKDLIDELNFLAVCRGCHNYIEEKRIWAIEKGFSIKRIN